MSLLTCDTSDLLATYKCLTCLSEKELLAVAVFALASGAGYTMPGEVNQLLEDSACFTCLSDKELMQANTAIPISMFLRNSNIADIRQDIICLTCATPKQLKAALTLLLCTTANQQIINMNLLDSGVVTLAGSNTTVYSASANPASAILLTYYSLDGNVATINYSNVVNGVSFNIHSSNNTDTNLVSWAILS